VVLTYLPSRHLLVGGEAFSPSAFLTDSCGKTEDPVWPVIVVHRRRLPSPPLGHCGESPSTLPPPMGSPWSRVPPRDHLLRWITAGQPKLTSKATPVKGGGGKESPVLPSGQKGKMGWVLSVPAGPSHCRSSSSAQCHFIFSIRIYSFQIEI
jgi:hypothetical protein